MMRAFVPNLCILALVLSVSGLKDENDHDIKHLNPFANPNTALFYAESLAQATLTGNQNLKLTKRSANPDPPPGKGKPKGKQGPKLVYNPGSENFMPFSDVPLHGAFRDSSGIRMEDGLHDGINTRKRRSPQGIPGADMMKMMPTGGMPGGGFPGGGFPAGGFPAKTKKDKKKSGRKRRDNGEVEPADGTVEETPINNEDEDHPWTPEEN